jgi:hypothetical protein
MEVEYQTDTNKQGRPRAINVRVVRDAKPYVQRGDARVYVAPAALARDRERQPRDFSRRSDLRRRAERLWSHPGADGI